MAKESKSQQSWKEQGMQDIRAYSPDLETVYPQEIKRTETINDAINIVANVFGFFDGDNAKKIHTPIGEIEIQIEHIKHIVEKRVDARERYTNHALDTLKSPFEIWKVEYEDGNEGEFRYIFLSLYAHKRQVVVIVSVWDKKYLWNFMQCDKKNLNKHRAGTLIYQNSKKQKAANL